MGNYLGTTEKEQQEMLKLLGLNTLDKLFEEIPDKVKISELNLPKGGSEREVKRKMQELAEKNKVFSTIFRGAGAYRHYIPAIVNQIAAKEEFVTAYTPYQAEISQGLLQSIFEYQTMICELTGMDATNASVYDGATAAAEAINMCIEKKRKKALIAATVHPMTLSTIKTYYDSRGIEIVVIPEKDGQVDLNKLEELMDETAACVLVQQPNYFGNLEKVEEIIRVTKEYKAKAVVAVNPLSMAVLKTPGEMGADIAVGEAQPLGLPLNFGGAYIGFIATTNKMMRRLPGRIVGETADVKGKRSFVLTLQAREQHIRREKAASNICSNVAHCALTVSIYLSAVGPEGLKKAAMQCYDKAHYMADKLSALSEVELVNDTDFFHEFVIKIPVEDEKLLQRLEERGILGGLPTERGLLWCVTEMNTKEEIDEVVSIVNELIREEAAI
ncbi:aminomethyl-transferring glycine dehydrogenase subunit GcvPA [Enterococcus sp. BWT-B8]|uniref:aminomethyl-transferring glycine dehydrogenase subunit GcvPA n=1 Tax=Enterococcus sp. BWT-B8 TaxID=2885157 RepID=UPI001E53D751|nr:aminomethyl-transferring glycine dehydrogenase subunit GcvPA [Enterococcus sp. BWT-B8]MCB5950819.1 aminomethyl-transferring glycine dehydrogenase subunit GcvPA [Enterococcus sp. BWT-B8]